MHPVLHVGRLEGLAHQIRVLMSFLQATSCKWRDLFGTVGLNMGTRGTSPTCCDWSCSSRSAARASAALNCQNLNKPCTNTRETQRSLSFSLCYWSSCLLLQNKRSMFQWLQPRTKWQVDAILRLSWCQLSKVIFTNSMHSCLQLSSMQHQKIWLDASKS